VEYSRFLTTTGGVFSVGGLFIVIVAALAEEKCGVRMGVGFNILATWLWFLDDIRDPKRTGQLIYHAVIASILAGGLLGLSTRSLTSGIVVYGLSMTAMFALLAKNMVRSRPKEKEQ
jgi:hypothetical protein